MALVCEHGPFSAHLASAPCPGDAALAAEVAGWLLDRVWTGFDPPPAPPALGLPHAAWVAPTDVESFGMVGAGDDIQLWWSPGVDHGLIDLHTGVLLGYTGVFAERPDPDPLDGIPIGVSASEEAGWSEGPAALVGYLHRYPLEVPAPRLLFHDGDAWGAVPDGCVDRDLVEVFAAEDRVWFAWLEGRTLSWSPIGGPLWDRSP
jgi:hypothetical protein